ncbi:hypothetical protein I4U23_023728 [Adineta vaga]|nr:hypothetical protein I4U23_023728 [Adineta vaga]
MSHILTLKDYAALINLQPLPLQRSSKKIKYDSIIRELVEYFSGPNSPYSKDSIEQQRSYIRHCLTIREPSLEYRYPTHIYDLIDQMLTFERDHKKSLTFASNLPIRYESLPHIRIWRGDITTLIVDAIVNAANGGLLGCFQPTHLCIDNIIHAAAGPHLRDDCYTIMQKQGRPEPVGHAKITIGYNLPSKYVIHTVGPQLLYGARVTEDDARQLASCYESCLNLATEIDTITSIAFCCISTGLFAFPADHACHIAIQTVTDWFRQRGSNTKLSLVVFDVFSAEDEQRYIEKLNNFCK